MCHPMGAHWRHLANTIELVIPLAHPSPQPKRQIDRFSSFAQLTAESLFYNGRPFPKNCPFPWGDLKPHLSHDSQGPSELTTHLDRFSCFCRAHQCDTPTDHTTRSVTIGYIYTYMWVLRCGLKCPIRTTSLEVAPVTLATFLLGVNFRLAVIYLQFPIQVCFSATVP